MARVKESVTIEQELSDYIRKQANNQDISVSELINRLIEKEMKTTDNIFSELELIEFDLTKLAEKKTNILKKIEKILEEGNKQEREKAKQKLLEEEKKYQEVKDRMILCYNRLKELGYLEEIQKYEENEDLMIICKEIYKKNMEEGKPLSNSVGLYDIKRLKDFMKQLNFEEIIK